ncbi:MAG: glutamate 5-kinase [Cyclobacteriaceae bacterium]
MKQKLVIKIGTSTLTAGTDRISRGKLEDLARQFLDLKSTYDIILVTSGAIATAKQYINIKRWQNQDVESKQAMSAIGQPKLMQLYSEVFSDFDIRIAQCLMTYRDFENPESRKNTRNTINELIKHDWIPIFNENDTVAVEELILGDNDKLSALIATLVDADKLIIASDIDGLYTKNPHLHTDAEHITEVVDLASIEQYIQERDNGLGTGGMTSKLNAVRICENSNVEVTLVNGGRPNFIIDSLSGKIPCTKFTRKPQALRD